MALKAGGHRGATGGAQEVDQLFSADSSNSPDSHGAQASPPLAHQNGQAAPSPPMSKSEREDLQRLVRQRERVLKSAAKQRSAELLADFENQMGAEYRFDQDEVWAQATKAAEREVQKAQAQVAARCRELGIPAEFAPSLHLDWCHRGYGNMLDERRKELRVMAETRIEALEAKAITEIEMSCLEAQTQIAVAGLTSDVAKSFIEKLPSVQTLMPQLISGKANRQSRSSSFHPVRCVSGVTASVTVTHR
jgi:hypothetical protein